MTEIRDERKFPEVALLELVQQYVREIINPLAHHTKRLEYLQRLSDISPLLEASWPQAVVVEFAKALADVPVAAVHLKMTDLTLRFTELIHDLGNHPPDEELGEPMTLEALGSLKPFKFASRDSWPGSWMGAKIDEVGLVIIGLKGAKLYGKDWEGKVVFNAAGDWLVQPVTSRH